MRLKTCFYIGLIFIISFWSACLVIYPNPILYLGRLIRTLSPSHPQQLVFNVSKWRNCTIPTEIHSLCSLNATYRARSCPLEELTQDCALLKHIHGYHKPVDQVELDFPLAFSIKVHTNPEQVEQLLRTIYRPHNVYCIHVDTNASDRMFRVMSSIAACFPNVFLSPRISYVYASYDAVRAELRTMACALESSVNWKYYLNLAGQEFPLRTNLEIVSILQLLNGTNDIESFPMPLTYRSRYTHIHRIIEGNLKETGDDKGPPPFNISVRKGTQYSAFSRAFIISIFYDDDAKSVMEYLKNSRSPEESIWATINQLPWIPGGYPVHVEHSPKNEHISRAVAWKFGDSYKCKGKYVREVCIFNQADLPWLLKQPNLFINKFRSDMDSRPEACLEAVVDQRVRSRALNLNQSYYKNLPHVKFRSNNTYSFNATDNHTSVEVMK